MELEIKDSVKETLQRSGLDWTVREEELKTVNTNIVIPKKKVVLRVMGNDEDGNPIQDVPLGIHSTGYEVFQNDELMELLFQLSQRSGLELKKGGYFGNGEKVFVQLKSTDLILPGDAVKGYITGINSFDGSTSLAFGNYDKTISCQNSFWYAYNNGKFEKIRHTASLRASLDTYLYDIEELLKNEKDHFDQIKRLIDVDMNSASLDLAMRILFDLDKDSKLDDPEMSTRKKNSIDQFKLDLGRELSQKGENLWGLFSGVTRYTTHSMKKGDNTQSKMLGNTGNKERKIWNELITV